MLMRQIPRIPSELFDQKKDKTPNPKNLAFINRCNVIQHLVDEFQGERQADGKTPEAIEIILDFMDNPKNPKASQEDIVTAFSTLIFEGHLFTFDFSGDEFEEARELATMHFNADDETGTNCFERALEKCEGMDIYCAAFYVTQELIDTINREVRSIAPHSFVAPPQSRILQ